MFAQLLATITLGLCSWSIINLLQNYRKAQKIGLPILITPIPIRHPVWHLSQDFIMPILKCIPFGITNFLRYSTWGWNFNDKYYLHEKYGGAFIVVSPDATQLVIADAGAAEDVFSRRKDFVKAYDLYKILEIFGRNVNTVNGDVWQRHRRITAPPFNERNSNLVWQESRRQADDMLRVWTKQGQDGVPRMDKDFMTLTLHVLCRAGFGKSYAFDEGVATPSEGHTMSYRDALKAILDNIIIALTVGSKSMPSWVLPAKVSLVQTAVVEFKKYMTDMVEAERTCERSVDQDNLMSALFRASEAEAESSQGRNGLSDKEIFGNLFIYNLAGHDTTAMTAVFAIALLSTDAHWQSWIGEEIVSVLGTEGSVEKGGYDNAFPKLKRCLAVMFETLRLYGPVVYTPRTTESQPQNLSIDGKVYVIPPDTALTISQAALHSLPENWGSDSLVWRPDRWLESASKGELGEEELITPPPGVFLPWISGPRVCPGKKFAQVEFVAIMASLFKGYRARVLPSVGETQENARRRARKEIDDSCLKITLSIKHPEKIRLVWEEVQ